MSDDILAVTTDFSDVASLAQGYMNRADGERLLLPLPISPEPGSGLRFVVLLVDGTPAFAGAGLCAQVSDQGDTVASEQRYETLLDTLQFDERSRPVYDYIVAVRNASYAQDTEGHEAADVDGGEVEALVDEPETAAADTGYADPNEQVIWSAEQPDSGVPSDPPGATSWAPSAQSAAPIAAAMPTPAPMIEDVNPGYASFIPPPLPTGLLSRPARAAHWQPAAPNRPTPRPVTGMFRYPAGPLPKPARPPRPQLDPALRVGPAPRP